MSAKSGDVGDLGIGQLVVVRRRDVWDALAPRPLHEPRHRRNDGICPRDRELPTGIDEVDLRVDVPEEPLHVTSSSRGFGRRRRPTFAEGSPSVTTMSAVKSFEPRIERRADAVRVDGNTALLERTDLVDREAARDDDANRVMARRVERVAQVADEPLVDAGRREVPELAPERAVDERLRTCRA